MANINVINYIISEFNEIARSRGLDFTYAESCNLLLNCSEILAQFKHPLYTTPLSFAYADRSNSIIDAVEFIQSSNKQINEKWFDKSFEDTDLVKEKTYRDELVKRIKLAGQDLIDRAESFVAKDLSMIDEFNINLNFPSDSPTNISIVTNTYSTKEIENYEKGE